MKLQWYGTAALLVYDEAFAIAFDPFLGIRQGDLFLLRCILLHTCCRLYFNPCRARFRGHIRSGNIPQPNSSILFVQSIKSPF